MKRLKRSGGLTGRRRDEGSVALEASLVMPVVLMVILFFICLIRMASVEMALHGAVSQTVRQAAGNIRPVELAMSQVEAHLPSSGKLDSIQELPGVDAVADKLKEWLPAPAG